MLPDAPRFAAILGLGFGDCGKGLFTDHLCRRWPVRTVVRFNGGGQAGHNVVLPDGRHHTFSQFGAGSFVPGVRTLLASPVVIHPSALLIEEGFLRRAGVVDALQRLRIDARCPITTPYHQAAGRLREQLRGGAAHGSCGVGVGETVRLQLTRPELALRYGDLHRPALARDQLEAIRCQLLARLAPRASGRGDPAIHAELRILADPSLADRWREGIQPLLRAVPPAGREQIGACLDDGGGCVLFEGAQGALLDEWHGFHPHTTWSTTLSRGAAAVLADAGIDAPVLRLGVLRSYLTRHGTGPLPTHDPALDILAEAHNADDGWQGLFRRGQPDRVLLRYAAAVNGGLDGLLVSHLDVFARGHPLRCCEAYRGPDGQRLDTLPVAPVPDLRHQRQLTRLLTHAVPCYAPQAWRSIAACLEGLADAADAPVLLGARGPTHTAVDSPRQLT